MTSKPQKSASTDLVLLKPSLGDILQLIDTIDDPKGTDIRNPQVDSVPSRQNRSRSLRVGTTDESPFAKGSFIVPRETAPQHNGSSSSSPTAARKNSRNFLSKY